VILSPIFRYIPHEVLSCDGSFTNQKNVLCLLPKNWSTAAPLYYSFWLATIPGITECDANLVPRLENQIHENATLHVHVHVYTIKSPERVSVTLLREPSSGHVSYFELNSAYWCCVECCHLRVDLYTNWTNSSSEITNIQQPHSIQPCQPRPLPWNCSAEGTLISETVSW
jgi:hypothetical protein